MTFVALASVFLILIGCKNTKNNETIYKSEQHFAIIPHFMLNAEKVDDFYGYVKDVYYKDKKNPDYILLTSPNHFYNEIKYPITICESDLIYYKFYSISMSNKLKDLGIQCDNNEKIFYSWGESIKTNEHGIGEHFQRINKYFSESEVLPLIMPTHNFKNIEKLIGHLKQLQGNILVIASVDFAHYLPEEETIQRDKKSIEILEGGNDNMEDFIKEIDADCPTCLYVLQTLAKSAGQRAKLQLRDSSSTILNYDVGEQNTSRIFMRYE